MKPPRRIPSKKELERLQKLYKSDEKIAERLGNVPVYLVGYWRRKRGVPNFSAPKFSEGEIKSVWERFGSDDRCGAELGISRAAYYSWRRKYGIKRKPAFLILEQMEFQFPGKEYSKQRNQNYGKRPAALKLLWEKRDGQRSAIGESIEVTPDLIALSRSAHEVCESFMSSSVSLTAAQRTVLSTGARNGSPPDINVMTWGKRRRVKRLFGPQDGPLWDALERTGARKPGQLVCCENGDDRFIGAVGGLGISGEPKQLADTLRHGKASITTPGVAQIILTGKRYTPITATDILLQLLSQLPGEKLNDTTIEYSGSSLKSFSVYERETFCAISSLSGADNAIVPCDSVTIRYLAGGRHDFNAITPDSDAEYAQTFQLNIEQAPPMVAWLRSQRSVDFNAQQSALDLNGSEELPETSQDNLIFRALEALNSPPIDTVFIGGSPGGRIDELKRAAEVFRSAGLIKDVAVFISPFSKDDYLHMVKKGLARVFLESGATILRPGADCAEIFALGVPESSVVVTSAIEPISPATNYAASRYMVSATSAAAAAVTGRLVDPRGL